MYKYCSTEESAHRQRQLEQCLLELMEDFPYASITVGQICELAGVSRKSFYRYFDSKDGCLHALVDHAIMAGSAYYMSEGTGLSLDEKSCVRIFEFWQQQTPLLNVMARNGQSLLIPQRTIRYIAEEEQTYARAAGIPEHNMMEHIVFTVSGIMGLILAWHHDGYPKTARQMGELLHEITQNRKL